MTDIWLLYATEFFAGMSVMAVELGASRLLAPYFSSSQIVWTIIIGTIMIAMSLGSLYGGKTSVQTQKKGMVPLYRRIAIAGLWIAAIPAVGKYIVLGIGAAVVFLASGQYLILAAFLSCLVLFVFPLFLLGTVTPSLAKAAARTLDETGTEVGRLNAANTIGSILGTFIPTFISIPAIGTNATFLVFAAILLILAGLGLFGTRTDPSSPDEPAKEKKSRRKKGAAALAFFVACCLLGADSHYAFWAGDLTYEGESIYNYLQVYEDGQDVVFSTNTLFGVQSVWRRDQRLGKMYYDYALAAAYMADILHKADLRCLILGMGTGTYANQCLTYFPQMQITGVEIDEKITELARRYFNLPSEIPVITGDGRAYLQQDRQRYDIILVDAYQDITIPYSMSSVEFYRMVREHLSPDGIMVVNLNMRSRTPGSINEYLTDTVSAVFSQVCAMDIPAYTNRLLFAGDGAPDLSERLSAGMLEENREELASLMTDALGRLEQAESAGRCLTDDKAPVELLGLRAVDEIIREEVKYYKEAYLAR